MQSLPCIYQPEKAANHDFAACLDKPTLHCCNNSLGAGYIQNTLTIGNKMGLYA